MNAPLDITGQRYGRLLAIKRAPNRGRRTYWLFQCDCEKTKEIGIEAVRSGSVQSCGCLMKEVSGARWRTHGLSNTRAYSAWLRAKSRCYDTNNEKYPQYGGRGIIMCKEWIDDFPAFYAHMNGECPDGLSLDRINPHRHYEPGNCRWATDLEQARTRTDNVWVEYKGNHMILKDFAILIGVDYTLLHYHVHKRGRDPFQAAKRILKRKLKAGS